jgi:hypothetical protein
MHPGGLVPGVTLGSYRIERLLGRDGPAFASLGASSGDVLPTREHEGGQDGAR